MIHYLTLGHLDPDGLRECAAVATKPLDETTVRTAVPTLRPSSPRQSSRKPDGGMSPFQSPTWSQIVRSDSPVWGVTGTSWPTTPEVAQRAVGEVL